MLSNKVPVSLDAKTKRLSMKVPFHLNDIIRNFPSRRFDPKTKLWKVQMVKGNILAIQNASRMVDFEFTPEAKEAIDNFEKVTARPSKIPFPRHVYDFSRSKVPYLPMDHQWRMMDEVYGLPAAAWIAKMGTGKTFAAIHLACARFQGGLIDAVMIVCPSTLQSVWRKEFTKFATNDYEFKEHQTNAKWLKEWYGRKPDPKLMQVMTVSVEGLGVSEQMYDSSCGFMVGRRVMVIVDESSRIKNPEALRTQRTWNYREVSDYRLILNGTPIAKGIHCMYAQYEFLDPNIIGAGDWWAFKTRYVEYGGYENRQIVGYKNVGEFMDLIRYYTVEVDKSVLNLPPKIPKQRIIQASPEQKALLRLVLKGSTGSPDEPLIKVDNVLERTLRQRQIVGGWLPRWIPKPTEENPDAGETVLEPLSKNPKLDDLMNMIDDNFEGSKFVIWACFRHEIVDITDQLAKKYGGHTVKAFFGDTSKAERSLIEDAYCDPESPLKFIVANPATAGLGLTFISGLDDIMWYYSGTNSFIDRQQSEDRCHRTGQKNSVVVGDSIMENTVDELIMAAHEYKLGIEEYVYQCLAEGKDITGLTG